MIKNTAQRRKSAPQYIGMRTIVSGKSRLLCRLMVTAAVVSTTPPSGVGAAALPSAQPACATLGCITQPGVSSVEFKPMPVQAPGPKSTRIGQWHLVRTPARENKETVSIMRTGELLKSDADFAGLMIRCKGTAGLQIGFIVVSPFPPRSQPNVTISTGASTLEFRGSVAGPGTVVSLPDEASTLIHGPWRSAQSLTVHIKGDGASIRGTVSLNQLSQAVALLQANCPTS